MTTSTTSSRIRNVIDDRGENGADLRFASPVDEDRHGQYQVTQDPADPRPFYRFTGRISADGSSGYPAQAGRYHVYAGWFCPWAQRITLQIALNGLTDIIGVSYVDDVRDGRGWAFRQTHGPDPVNGFELLRDAYEATEPGFDGHISVPTLWDTGTNRVVSNDFRLIGIDIATQFRAFATPGVDTYPADLRDDIEALDVWIGHAVNRGLSRAGQDGPEGEQARDALTAAFTRLDGLLDHQQYLVGDTVTEADVRLWVSLARYDVQANAGGRIGPPLSSWTRLAAYASRLAASPAFVETTRWQSFSTPGSHLSFPIPAAETGDDDIDSGTGRSGA